MKIFVSIASYQDPLLANTILDAFNNASNKNSLVFGICDQSKDSLDLGHFQFSDQIRYEHVDTIFSKGPCWARARIQELHQDEEYYLQIDSHSLFDEAWDKKLINALNELKTLGRHSFYHKKPFLTGYPRAFELNAETNLFEKDDDDKKVMPIAYRKDSLFMKDKFSRQIGLRTSQEKFSHGFLLAAGFIFSDASMIKEVPYDQYYYFYGEELSLMLRLFTHGYSAFHMADLPIFHLYSTPENIKRPLHWSPEEDKKRATKWHELEKKSIERLSNLIHGKNLDGYCLGTERTLDDYKNFSGIDLFEKKVVDERKATTNHFFEHSSWQDNPILVSE